MKKHVSLRDGLRHTASAGYVAKGVIYLTIGWLALLTAIGLGGSESGASEVIRKIALWPFGPALLALLGLGLVAYVLWRLGQAIWDTERKGNDWKGWIQRLGFAISGGLYATLAWQCATLVFQSLSQAQGGGTSENTERVMGIPGGRWLLVMLGLVFIGVGIHQMALSPSDAQGLGAALNLLAHQPFGDWLLGTAAVGLMAYGGYCFINAGYRRIRPPQNGA